MRLSCKQKTFPSIFSAFLEFGLIFKHFEIKDDPFIADLVPKLQIAKDVVRQISKQSSFKRPFNKQHGNRCQTLLKSEGQHLSHVY